MQTNFRSPTAFDTQAIARNGFHDQGILVVKVDDPRLSWADRELLKAIGDKLFGRRYGTA